MIWTAPSEKDTATDTLGKRLRDAADQLCAESGLQPQEYSGPIFRIQNLRRTRDLLLPRLLSGQVQPECS